MLYVFTHRLDNKEFGGFIHGEESQHPLNFNTYRKLRKSNFQFFSGSIDEEVYESPKKHMGMCFTLRDYTSIKKSRMTNFQCIVV